MRNYRPWRVSGTYFEVWKCNAGYFRRRFGQNAGDQPACSACHFALSWHVREGAAAGVDLSDLSVVMVGRYNSLRRKWPSHVLLFLDERGHERQCEALANIFLGRAGGRVSGHFGAAIEYVQAIHCARIALDHRPDRESIVVGSERPGARACPVPTERTDHRGSTGQHHPVREFMASPFPIPGEHLYWRVSGRRGFRTYFLHSSRG